MAPFQVNGKTQGLLGLAPPLVKHSDIAVVVVVVAVVKDDIGQDVLQ